MDIAAWPNLTLVEQILEGNRNTVWKGDLAGRPVAVRRSKRPEASLNWELDLVVHLDSLGFRVPTPVSTLQGALHENGVVVQRWLEGEPPTTPSDWDLVARELRRLHAATSGYVQRPGCCVVTELATHRRSVDADLDAMPQAEQQQVIEVFRTVSDAPTAVIHGDPNSSNIRIADGIVGLLDWDESRVDVVWHDLSELATTEHEPSALAPQHRLIARRLSNAWEAVNGWTCEPSYARRRLAALRAHAPGLWSQSRSDFRPS